MTLFLSLIGCQPVDVLYVTRHCEVLDELDCEDTG